MRNERGVVLVIAVLAMITVTILGIAAMMTSDIEVRISGNQRSMDAALYAADGGIDRGLSWLAGSGATRPDEVNLPTIEETREPPAPDPDNDEIYSQYYIGDLHHSRNPPRGWDITKFRRYFYKIHSTGYEESPTEVKPESSAEVEVIASIIYPSEEY